jgi:hypothetical protein
MEVRADADEALKIMETIGVFLGARKGSCWFPCPKCKRIHFRRYAPVLRTGCFGVVRAVVVSLPSTGGEPERYAALTRGGV